jgi:hypothetical protein
LIGGVDLSFTNRVGTNNALLVGKVAQSAADGDNLLSEDDYVIRTFGTAVLLFGGSPRATLYAVYDFLERLDCG